MNMKYTLFLICLIFQVNKIQGSLCDIFESAAKNISAPCLNQMKIVCNSPQLGWKLYDASSKFLTPGMTYSNVIDYGNFPECLSIKHSENGTTILGKYCGISEIIVNILLTPQTEKILPKYGIDIRATLPQTISVKTLQDLTKEVKDILIPDIPYVLSKYSSCVPDACTPSEVGHFFLYADILSDWLPLIIYTNLPCETVDSNTELKGGEIAVIFIFALIGVLMIASTVYDALCQNFQKKREELFLAFSILHNGKKLLQISNNKTEQIQIFNGMRFISMMWVVSYHAVTVFEAGVVSLENFPEVQDWSKTITNRYILSGILSVDTFFFISAFLLAFTYLKSHLDEPFEKQIFKIPKFYLHRYLRLTPSAGAMFLVTVTIFRFMGRGPTWSMVTKLIKDSCTDKWWKFFLYIQNYTDPDTMCVNPSWYLSADMQMFILAPLVLVPVAIFAKKKFKWTILALSCLTIVSVLIPMIVRLSTRDAGNLYTAHERFNNFLIGIAFGTFMRLHKTKEFVFSKTWNFIIWVVILVVALAFNLYWFDVLYNYDIVKYAIFMALYRPVWCLSLAFMVYSCYHNHGGFVQWFLERPSFQILAKLSYSMYIVHFLVEIYAGASLSTQTYFSNYFLFYNFCGHLIVTMIVSIIWVFAFEYPMMIIEKYIVNPSALFAKNRKKL